MRILLGNQLLQSEKQIIIKTVETRNLVRKWDPDEINNIRRIIQDPNNITKPYLISSGITLTTEDNKVLLYIRSIYADIFSYRLQDFSGLLNYKMTPLENAYNTLLREVVIFRDDGTPILPIIPGVKPDNKQLEKWEHNVQQVKELLDYPRKQEETVQLLPETLCTSPSNIIFVLNNKPRETSTGYHTFIKTTNTLEISYIYRLPIKSSEFESMSLEFVTSPTVIIGKKVLPYLPQSHFTPRFFLNIIKRMRQCIIQTK